MDKPRCTYKHPKYEDGRCPREPRKGWTTCSAHYTAGKAKKQAPGRSYSIKDGRTVDTYTGEELEL